MRELVCESRSARTKKRSLREVNEYFEDEARQAIAPTE